VTGVSRTFDNRYIFYLFFSGDLCLIKEPEFQRLFSLLGGLFAVGENMALKAGAVAKWFWFAGSICNE